MSNLTNLLDNELAALNERVQQSLVQVANGRSGAGAGVIWQSNGVILTNAHVLHGRHPRVTLADGRTFDADIIAFDREHDLAALKINATALPEIARGNSAALRPGDWVFAIGHPWGIRGAATAGAVIAIGQPVENPASSGRFTADLIQVALTLRPGHSGGPMVDSHGRLIGINTMISGPQVGLAIPIHTVEGFMRQHAAQSSTADYI